METLQEFLKRKDIRTYLKERPGDYIQKSFTRDPLRPIVYAPDRLYSPADGFITYARVVQPDERLVQVKGVQYTVRELLRDKSYNHTSLVVGVYMTFLDVHFNRMPTDGWLEYKFLPPIDGYNLSMRMIEEALLSGRVPDFSSGTYLVKNQRCVCTVRSPHYDKPIYIVQIADEEVDRILQFSPSGTYYRQGDKFSLVIGGSQVDLVVPLSTKYFVENLVVDRENMHVEAGIDPLARIGHMQVHQLLQTVFTTRATTIKSVKG